jgi:hypothetical protein
MEEKTLVKMLIIVGIVSLSVITVSNTLLGKIILRFTSKLVPYIFCEQDYKGNYILAKPTSFDVCKKMDDIKDLINPNICEGFINEEKTACLGLMEIAKNRTSDCLTILFGTPKTSVNPADVERYCKILNVTFPNVSIQNQKLFNITVRKCYSHNDCWFTEYSNGCCLGQCNLQTNECYSSPQTKDYTAYGQEYYCSEGKVCGSDCKCH